MSLKPARYDASHIQVSEGLEAVRKRPGMYVGTTGERGVRHMVFDIAERALGEILDGRASRLQVALLADGGVRVADDADGVAFGEPDGVGLDRLLTMLHCGTRSGRRMVASFGGGLAVVNALSSRLVAEVWSGGVRETRVYSRGIAVIPPAEQAESSVHADAGSAVADGTAITFWPDSEIFEGAELSFDALADRFRELVFLNSGLDISITDERSPEPRSLHFPPSDGVRDMVAYLDGPAAAPVHSDVIAFAKDDPRMEGTMEVAFRWRDSSEKQLQCFANGMPTPYGGVHALGFHDGLKVALNAYAREQHLLTAADPDLGVGRIGKGLTAVVSVKLDFPRFEGCTRGELGNAEVRACVREAVIAHLGTWLAEHPREAAAILEHLIRRAPRD